MISHEAEHDQHTKQVVARIDLPPEEPLVGGGLIMVAIVVPAFAHGDEREQQRILARIGGGVAAVPACVEDETAPACEGMSASSKAAPKI